MRQELGHARCHRGLSFAVFFEFVAPQIFPYDCVGAFRTCDWTVNGPGGGYGYVDCMGADFVRLGPLGETSVRAIKRIGLSAIVALLAVAFLSNSDIGTPKQSTEKIREAR
jgi:hypothetical protein